MTWQLKGNITGPAGTRGATWHSGATAPTGALTAGQRDGDLFLVTSGADQGKVFIAAGGQWPVAPATTLTGAPGAAGSVLHSGATAAMVDALGAAGDYFFDTTTNSLHGPKDDTATPKWPVTGITLKGADGTPGSVWSNGPDDPNVAPAPGRVGDYYLETTHGDVFRLSAAPTAGGTAWLKVGTIMGPMGAGVVIKGTLDDTHPLHVNPAAGDMVIAGTAAPTAGWPNGLTPAAGDGLVFDGATWKNVGPIRGPQGIPGTAGKDGSRWFTTASPGADVAAGTATLTPATPAPVEGDYVIIIGSTDVASNGQIYRLDP